MMHGFKACLIILACLAFFALAACMSDPRHDVNTVTTSCDTDFPAGSKAERLCRNTVRQQIRIYAVCPAIQTLATNAPNVSLPSAEQFCTELKKRGDVGDYAFGQCLVAFDEQVKDALGRLKAGKKCRGIR